MNIGKRIKKIRESLGLTQEEFGHKIDLSSGTISNIEKGSQGNKKGIGAETLKRIARAFKVDLNWLVTGEKHSKILPTIVAEPKTDYDSGKKLIPIPVINDVPAGYPEYPVLDDEIRAHVYLPRVPKQSFGLYVSGDSMKPDINDGDIVIVNPNIEEVKKGDIGVFKINEETTIKYCIPLDDGYILQPANSNYKPIVVSGETECILIGKVIYKIIKCN